MNTVQEYLSNHWRRYAVNLNSSIILGLIALVLIIVLPACGSTSLPEPLLAADPLSWVFSAKPGHNWGVFGRQKQGRYMVYQTPTS